MFGLDEKGKSYSIDVLNFKPYFFVKVGNNWANSYKKKFLKQIYKKLAKLELGKRFDNFKSGKSKNLYPPFPKKEVTWEEVNILLNIWEMVI